MFCKRVAVAPWIGYSKACTTGAQCEAAPAAILAGTVPSPLLHPASKELFSVWLSKGIKIWCAGTAWWSVVSCFICCSQITSPYSLLPCTFCTVYSLAFPSLACTVFFSVPFPLKFQICYCLHQSYPVILLSEMGARAYFCSTLLGQGPSMAHPHACLSIPSPALFYLVLFSPI